MITWVRLEGKSVSINGICLEGNKPVYWRGIDRVNALAAAIAALEAEHATELAAWHAATKSGASDV
jgi:Tfp pilus assembly protein PilN